jgi:tetratricopeptide (TPR) repeat protein
VKRHRGSTDIPSARRNRVSIALPHDKSGVDRAAEIEALLERVATPAVKAGRRQALNKFPSDGQSKLELVQDSLPAPGPSTHAGNTAFVARTFALASGTTSPVDYIAIAKKEFEEGQIDQPLWARAFVEAGGDESSAMPSYLRARATALRLWDRAKQAEAEGRQARTSTSAPSADSASRHMASGTTRRNAGRDTKAKAWLRSPIAILGMLISLVIAVTLVIASRPSVEPIVASRSPGGAQPGATAGSGKSMSASNDAAMKAAGPGAGQDFRNTIQGLKDAGNWNDVVLQASAWTAKEPESAAAWNELSIGYVNMRQLEDAHAASRKAVELAPRNALLWRNLGQLSLDLDVPIEALLAFEEATRWDPKDGYSFVQAGILNTRLDHLPEAKLAFANALALNPGDVNARCGAALVALRQARPDELKGSSQQPKLANAACRDVIDRASKAVDLRGPAAFNDVPSQGH